MNTKITILKKGTKMVINKRITHIFTCNLAGTLF